VEWGVERGGLKVGKLVAEQRHHLEAIGIGGGGAFGFERLLRGGSEEDAVECEGLGCGAGNDQVAAVGWIEAAAEEAYAHICFRFSHFASDSPNSR
jgi:hypothetical protein